MTDRQKLSESGVVYIHTPDLESFCKVEEILNYTFLHKLRHGNETVINITNKKYSNLKNARDSIISLQEALAILNKEKQPSLIIW